MDSKTLLFNRVLIHLGIAGQIDNFANDTVEAITISNNYDLARDFVLKDFDWNFAVAYRELSLASEINNIANNTSVLPHGYLYEYHYPDDCISARAVFTRGEKEEKEFTVASNDLGQSVILTDVYPAVLRYTRRIDKEKLFPSDFETAFSIYLAYLSAQALTGDVNKSDKLLQKYELFKRRAQKINADEGRNDNEDNSTYIDYR